MFQLNSDFVEVLHLSFCVASHLLLTDHVYQDFWRHVYSPWFELPGKRIQLYWPVMRDRPKARDRRIRSEALQQFDWANRGYQKCSNVLHEIAKKIMKVSFGVTVSLLASLPAFVALRLFVWFGQQDERKFGEAKSRWLSSFGLSAAYRLVIHHNEWAWNKTMTMRIMNGQWTRQWQSSMFNGYLLPG